MGVLANQLLKAQNSKITKEESLQNINKIFKNMNEVVDSFINTKENIPTKEEILRELNQLVATQKYVIYQHPKNTILLYEKLEPLLLSGSNKSWEYAYIKNELFLTEQEIILINKYIITSSFMSAWYDLFEDYEKRDKVSDSCLKTLSFLGLDFNEVFSVYYLQEKVIKNEMIKKKIRKRFLEYFLYIFITILVVLITVFAWTYLPIEYVIVLLFCLTGLTFYPSSKMKIRDDNDEIK